MPLAITFMIDREQPISAEIMSSENGTTVVVVLKSDRPMGVRMAANALSKYAEQLIKKFSSPIIAPPPDSL